MTATSVAVVAALSLSACASTLQGQPSAENAPNANLTVVGSSSGSTFDQTVKNSLSDIEAFWKTEYPKVSGGKPLPPLKGDPDGRFANGREL